MEHPFFFRYRLKLSFSSQIYFTRFPKLSSPSKVITSLNLRLLNSASHSRKRFMKHQMSSLLPFRR